MAAHKSSSGYDPSGFRPTVTHVSAASRTDVKGGVLLCAGGAFAIRGDNSDCYPTASALTARGHHCFVVDYRVRARILQNWPHGFGGEGGWIPEFDNFMQDAFALA
ncbi:MAG: hypothetical protein ACOX12_01410 [Eggerthellaceae bacterium]|jgi:acetyl esterase/lipase